MATTTATPVTESIKERVMPALESVEKNVRRARRAMRDGRYAAEDLAAATKLAVRHRPLRTLAVTAVVGAVAGCMFGYRAARRRARRNEEEEP